MQRISYCKGVIDVNNLSQEVAHVLDRLENGENAGLCIEKLRGHHLYSCRLNDADRLLFTYIERDGERYLLLLDIVLNHDYDKSFATKPHVLRNFIQLHGDVFKRHILREDFEAVDEAAIEGNQENNNNNNNVPEKSKRHYIEMEFFNDRFITLNAEQIRAIKVTLPAKVNGAAGSGKSGAAFARITDLAEAMSQVGGDQLPNVCYVTQSSALCDNMRENFQATRQARLVSENRISFKTYKDLVNSDLIPTGFKQFEEFIAEEIKAHRQRCKANQFSGKKDKTRSAINPFNNEFYKNVEVMYQEMRIISGVNSEEEYLELGDNQSLFSKTQKRERKWLYEVYQNYLKYLASDTNKQPMIDLGCCPVNVKPLHCICIVDESQDLSPVQLKVLEQISEGRVLYFYHKQQSLSDTLGKEHCLNEITNERNNKEKPIELKSSFRCPEAVLSVAQEFLDMGARLTGEALTPKPDSEIKEHRGTVRIITHLTEAEEKALRIETADPGCVIITNTANLEEARQRFGKTIIVTVEQFKGLEANTVILYRLLDDKIYARACELLPKNENSKVQLINKAFGPAFNSAYTACTRVAGAGKLVIVQDNPETLYRIQPIIERLKKHDTHKQQDDTKQLTEQQLQEQLFRRVKDLLGTKIESNIAIAKEIYIEKLHKTEEQFNELKSLYIEEVKQLLPPALERVASTSKRKKKAVKMKLMYAQEFNNKRLKEFVEYFTNPAYHQELFKVPAATGKECRFVEYMSYSVTRITIIMEILPTHASMLFRLPNFQFDRKTLTKPCDDDLLPPVFFFAMYEKTWAPLAEAMIERTNPFRFTGIAVQIMDEVYWGGMSAFYYLTTHEAGLQSLTKVVQANLDILRKLPMKFFFQAPVAESAKKRSIMDNLLDKQLSDENFDTLMVMLNKITGLGLNITVEHLTAKQRGTEIPRLVAFCSTARGKSLLEKLDALNPELQQLSFCKMSPEEAQRYCDIKSTQEKAIELKYKYVNGVVANPSEANLDRLFTRNDAYLYLFNIPTESGECLYARLLKNENANELVKSYIPCFIEILFYGAAENEDNSQLARILFTPLFDDECLLMHLLDHEEIRNELLNENILPSIRGFNNIVPECAFVRRNRSPGKHDALLWFCTYAPLTRVMINWISHNGVIKLISANAFFRPVSLEEYKAANLPEYADVFRRQSNKIVENGKQKSIQPWELLCLHSEGRTLLANTLDNPFNKHPCFRFTKDLRIADTESSAITLFHLLSKSEQGKIIIGRYLMFNKKAEEAIVKENLFLEGTELTENTAGHLCYQGNCALFEIFTVSCDAKMAHLLLSFAVSPNALEDARILNALFFAITPFCYDDELAVKRFCIMFMYPDLANVICDFAMKYPMLYLRFDSNLFLSETITDIRSNAIAALKANEAGKILFDKIVSYKTKIKSVRDNTTDLQRVSIFKDSTSATDKDFNSTQEPKGP